MRQWFRRLVAIVAVSTFFTVGVGCYGSFALTKKIYDWNGTIGDKFINSVVFVALVIVPVYGLSLLGDFLIFNTIEFWVGQNPIAQVYDQNGKRVEISASPEGEILLRTEGAQIKAGREGAEIRDADGKVLARLRPLPDGGAKVISSDKELTFSREEVASISEIIRRGARGEAIAKELSDSLGLGVKLAVGR